MKDNDITWKKLSEKQFKGAYKKYLTKHFRLPNGREGDFDTTSFANRGFVMALSLTADNQVLVVKQYRPGPERIAWDMPAGMIDDEDKDPAAAMARELREETGYKAGELIPLNKTAALFGPYDAATGFYFLARDCRLVAKPEPDQYEVIDLVTLPLRRFVNEVLRRGNATHADCGWLAIDYMLRHDMLQLSDIS